MTDGKARYDRAEAASLVAIARTRRALRAEAGRAALGDDQLVERLGLQLEAAQDRIAELERPDPLVAAFDRMRASVGRKQVARRSGVTRLTEPFETLEETLENSYPRPGVSREAFLQTMNVFEAARRYFTHDIPRWEDDGGAP